MKSAKPTKKKSAKPTEDRGQGEGRGDRGLFRLKSQAPENLWQVIENSLSASVKENARARRWRIFFRLAYLAIFVWILVLVTIGRFGSQLEDFSGGDHIALIRMTGLVVDKSISVTGINAEDMNESLRQAFENNNAKAIILSINSPGGSPVQAGQIFDEITRLRVAHPDKKVYAVIKELGASAAYYIAAASDEIYCDKSSLVGAIGVIGSGFGFEEAIDKLGIERRLYTSGEHKGFLDPFLPIDPAEEVFWEGVLSRIHEHFIDSVKKGRGWRLANDNEIFSGYIYDGDMAVALGLVDGFGTIRSVAQSKEGIVKFIDYTPRVNPVDRWFSAAARQLAIAFENNLLTKRIQ